MLMRDLEQSKNKVQREDDFKAIIAHLTNKYEEKCTELILQNKERQDMKGCEF